MKVIVRCSNTETSTKWPTIYDKIEDFNGVTVASYQGYSFEYCLKKNFLNHQ